MPGFFDNFLRFLHVVLKCLVNKQYNYKSSFTPVFKIKPNRKELSAKNKMLFI